MWCVVSRDWPSRTPATETGSRSCSRNQGPAVRGTLSFNVPTPAHMPASDRALGASRDFKGEGTDRRCVVSSRCYTTLSCSAAVLVVGGGSSAVRCFGEDQDDCPWRGSGCFVLEWIRTFVLRECAGVEECAEATLVSSRVRMLMVRSVLTSRLRMLSVGGDVEACEDADGAECVDVLACEDAGVEECVGGGRAMLKAQFEQHIQDKAAAA
eukprot:3262375-Rhodomonas_salina.1